MGAVTKVALPERLTGSASGSGGSLVSGLAGTMATNRARAQSWLRAVATETRQPSGDDDGADQEASLLIASLLAGRMPSLLTGSWVHDVVRARFDSIRLNAAVRTATMAAEPHRPTKRPCGRRRMDTRLQEAVVLEWMIRDGRPALEFKHEELIRRLEQEFPEVRTRPSRSTLRRRALEILERYDQLGVQDAHSTSKPCALEF